jgi:hypothetical protein
MTGYLATTSAPIGDSGGSSATAGSFDVRATLISQYANSPVLLGIIDRLAAMLDRGSLIDDFYDLVWNVATAAGWGLDVWGRIVGVSRVLRIPADVPHFGFAEQPLDQAIFYGGGIVTKNFYLTDDAFRRLVLAKAALNVSDGSIPSINAAMRALFPDRGNSHVRDDGGMAMTYVFGSQPSAVELAIIAQAGVLPKPIGVTVSAEVAS